MTFDEALKAFNSAEQEKAVALMNEIDKHLGIEAELRSSINESPDGANVVIVHDIKTAVDRETLRYVAAIKGRALLGSHPIQRSSGALSSFASSRTTPRRSEGSPSQDEIEATPRKVATS